MIDRKTINEFADAAKDRAMMKRNRGIHTGKMAQGHDWKRAKETDPHEIAAMSCLAAMRNTVAELRLSGESQRLNTIMEGVTL